MTTIPEDKLEGIISKGKELEKQLGQENTSEKFVELSKEYSEIQPLYNASMEWKESSKEIADLKNIIEDETNINQSKVNLNFSLNYEPNRFDSITLDFDNTSESTSGY